MALPMIVAAALAADKMSTDRAKGILGSSASVPNEQMDFGARDRQETQYQLTERDRAAMMASGPYGGGSTMPPLSTPTGMPRVTPGSVGPQEPSQTQAPDATVSPLGQQEVSSGLPQDSFSSAANNAMSGVSKEDLDKYYGARGYY